MYALIKLKVSGDSFLYHRNVSKCHHYEYISKLNEEAHSSAQFPPEVSFPIFVHPLILNDGAIL